MATDADIFEAMKQVEDPELGVNVVDLGLVYGVDQEDEGRKVRLDMTLTTVACPLTDMIEGATTAALIGLDEIQEVEINWVCRRPGARNAHRGRQGFAVHGLQSDGIEEGSGHRWRPALAELAASCSGRSLGYPAT
jgi:metal-sulfur cluster biosynthetic enzyme